MSSQPNPPRLAQALLVLLLPRGLGRDGVVGDLAEEHAELAKQWRIRARWWYWRQAVVLLVRVRLAPRRRPRPARPKYYKERPVSFIWLSGLATDVRYAARRLVRSPGFALSAVVVLSVGIGANATVFRLVDGVLLRPLPGVDDPASLITFDANTMSYPTFRDLRAMAAPAVEVAAFRKRWFSLGDGSQATLGSGGIVSGNYFSVIGAVAHRGRLLTPADADPGAPAVTVISHDYYRRVLAEDPNVIGREIVANGKPLTVVGVTEPRFRGHRLGDAADLWVPIVKWPELAPSSFAGLNIERRGWGWLSVFARVQPGTTIEGAAVILQQAAGRINDEYFGEGHPDRLRFDILSARSGVVPMRDQVQTFLGLLWVVAALVFLVTCTNVAHLVLTRSFKRRREIGVRLALGAPRHRLVRDVLAEAALIALAAGSAAVGLAFGAATLLDTMSLDGIPLRDFGFGFDGRLLGLIFLLSMATALFIGLLPAWRSARTDVTQVISGAEVASRARFAWWRPGFMGVQVAVCLVLLVGTGLFLRAMQRAVTVDVGFSDRGVAMVTTNLGLARYDTAQAATFYLEAARSLRQLPGVVAVAWTSSRPLTSDQSGESFSVPGYEPAADESMAVEVNAVAGDYFEVLSVPLMAGQPFRPVDQGGPVGVVINESMARRYWSGMAAVGQQIDIIGRTFTVTGIAHDLKYHSLQEDPAPYVYLPLDRSALWETTLMVRTAGDPSAMLSPVLARLRELAPDVPLYRAGVLEDMSARVLLPQRLAAAFLGGFSLVALAVALVGIYAGVALTVGQRTREIGVRAALGATPGSILGLVSRQSLTQIGLGLLVGAAVAVPLANMIEGFLYGVSGSDAVAYLATSLVLLATAGGATLVPALRALRVDPVTALKSER